LRLRPAALRHELDVRGITQAELAHKAGVAETTVSKVMRGAGNVRPDVAARLARALVQIKPIDLLPGLIEGPVDSAGEQWNGEHLDASAGTDLVRRHRQRTPSP
jgi:transcriptional regulator with XRE-family HTH domain